MRYETLIFDLDGTISDPFVGISRSINYALGKCGIDVVDPEDIRPWIGPPLTEIFEHFAGPLDGDRMESLVAAYRERYVEIGYAENAIYKGIPEIIRRLAGAGYTLGVCTAKRSDYAIKVIEHFSLGAYFQFVDGGGIGVTKTEQLSRIIDSGINPQAAVMIGDRKGDIFAAKANAMRSVGVLWGFGDEAEIETAAPELTARRPQDLESMF